MSSISPEKVVSLAAALLLSSCAGSSSSEVKSPPPKKVAHQPARRAPAQHDEPCKRWEKAFEGVLKTRLVALEAEPHESSLVKEKVLTMQDFLRMKSVVDIGLREWIQRAEGWCKDYDFGMGRITREQWSQRLSCTMLVLKTEKRFADLLEQKRKKELLALIDAGENFTCGKLCKASKKTTNWLQDSSSKLVYTKQLCAPKGSRIYDVKYQCKTLTESSTDVCGIGKETEVKPMQTKYFSSPKGDNCVEIKRDLAMINDRGSFIHAHSILMTADGCPDPTGPISGPSPLPKTAAK